MLFIVIIVDINHGIVGNNPDHHWLPLTLTALIAGCPDFKVLFYVCAICCVLFIDNNFHYQDNFTTHVTTL